MGRKLWLGLLLIGVIYFLMPAAFEVQAIPIEADIIQPNELCKNAGGTIDEVCQAIQVTYLDSFGRNATGAEVTYWKGRTDWKTPNDLMALHRNTLKENESIRVETIRQSYKDVFWRYPYDSETNNELGYWSNRVAGSGMNYKELVENHKKFLSTSIPFQTELIFNSYWVAFGREPREDELNYWMGYIKSNPENVTFWTILSNHEKWINDNKDQAEMKDIIDRAYARALGRDPKDPEYAGWSGKSFQYIIDMLKSNFRGSEDHRRAITMQAFQFKFKRDPTESDYALFEPKIKDQSYMYENIVYDLDKWVKKQQNSVSSDLVLRAELSNKGYKVDENGNLISKITGNVSIKVGDWAVVPKSGVVAAGGMNVVAAGGMNVVAAGGMNVVAAGGMNVVAAGGMNLVSPSMSGLISMPRFMRNIADTSTPSGIIAGTVYDDNSKPVYDAIVEFRDQNGHFRGSTETKEDGTYVMVDLNADETYSVAVKIEDISFPSYDKFTATKEQSENGDVHLSTLLQDMNLNGKKLLRDMTYLPRSGVATISGGTLDLNSHSLTVIGDLLQSDGNLLVNHGTLEVTGNYLLQSDGPDGLTYGYGTLQMQNDDERVIVRQDFVTQSGSDHTGLLTDGVLEVKGDFSQKYGSYSNFKTSGNFKVLLSGTDQQSVSFEYPHYSNSHFEQLYISNSSIAGVEFRTPVSVKAIKNLSKAKITAYSIRDLTLTEDLDIYTFDKNSSVPVKGQGTLLLEASDNFVDLNQHQLTVHGNVVQTDSRLKVNLGKLIVAGDYKLLNLDSGYSSYGILEMVNQADYVRVDGDFDTQSGADHTGLLSNGILEVKGDFSQKYGSYSNFKTSGNFKVILSGTGQQMVSFDNPHYNNSHFENLEVTNTSNAGVQLKTQVSVKNLKHASNAKVTAYSIRDLTLTNDVDLYTFDNNSSVPIKGTLLLELSDNIVDLNQHQLTVHGNVVQTDSRLKVNNGKLIVTGDYNLKGQDGYSAYGILEMVNEADYVLVEGNFLMQSGADHTGLLSDGVLEVKGDFSQKYGSYSNFKTSGNFKVILSGTAQQMVSFDNPHYYNSHFENLDVTNSSNAGVQFMTQVSVKNLKHASNAKVTAYSIRDLTLTNDVDIYTFDNNSSLPVKGTLLLADSDDVVDLNQHQLTVHGNLVQTDSRLKVNQGKLIVTGDYSLKNPDGNYSAYGILEMANAADYVLVEGNFLMQSGSDHTGLLSNGVLEVKGDFSQKYGSYSNFKTSGNHKVILSGTKKQTVHFDNPDMNNSHFTILELSNSSLEGIEFLTDYNYVTLIDGRIQTPVVKDVTDQDKVVTGQTSPGAKVEVRVNGELIGSNDAGPDGAFAVTIPIQKAGTELWITATSKTGVTSPVVKKTVMDQTPPTAPVVFTFTDLDTTLSGTTEAKAQIFVKVGNTEIGKGAADDSGRFAITVLKQKAGTKITVIARDSSNNESKADVVTQIGYVTKNIQLNGKNFTLGYNNGSGTTYLHWKVLNEFKIPFTNKGNGLYVIDGRQVQAVKINNDWYINWSQIAPGKVTRLSIKDGYNFVYYIPVKVQLNGKAFSNGYLKNGEPYLHWKALDEFKLTYTNKGNGVFVINGRQVQAVKLNNDWYILWSQIVPGKVTKVAITGGYNFVYYIPVKVQLNGKAFSDGYLKVKDGEPHLHWKALDEFKLTYTNKGNGVFVINGRQVQAFKMNNDWYILWSQIVPGKVTKVAITGGYNFVYYIPVKVQLNGKAFSDGYLKVKDGEPYLHWKVLNEFKLTYTNKGNGLYVINGRQVQAVKINNDWYILWSQLVPGKVTKIPTKDGYNFNYPLSVKIQLNGKNFTSGYFMDSEPFVHWTALKTLKISYTDKGNGVYVIQGRTVKAEKINAAYYIRWSLVAPGKTSFKPITGGYNLIYKP